MNPRDTHAASGLAVRDMRVAYGKTRVLDGVSLSVEPGETLVLFGPSGGKTVLLRAIAGVEPQAAGQVWVAGRDVSALGPERRDVGVAFQNFALYPHMTARDNIASPLRARRLGSAEVEGRVARLAALRQIGHVLGPRPRERSNGQKQRTALARALVGEPKALLLDDPLRNVDAKLRYEMRLELPRLLRRAEAATIYVSQDYREAMALGDRIAVLAGGRIMQDAPPEAIYDAPATVAVARLFGDPPVNLVPCRPQSQPAGLQVEALGLALILDRDRAAAGRDCLLGLRPESVQVHADARPGAAPAELVAVTPLHERLVLLLRTQAGEEVLASAADGVGRPGSAVWIGADPRRALLYDAASGQQVARVAPVPAPVEAAA